MHLEFAYLTERDARVLFANLLTVVVGEEHVRGETTLGCVGVYRLDQSMRFKTYKRGTYPSSCAQRGYPWSYVWSFP